MWTENSSEGFDVTATFMGVSTPIDSLYGAIHSRGWEVTKVKPTKDGYEAEAKNPANGQKVTKVGATPETAVAALLMALTRIDFIRTQWTAHRLGAWKQMWTDRLDEVAQAYAKAPVYDPKAVPAWQELALDSKRRREHLEDQLQIEVVDNPHPYDTPEELFEDVTKKSHFFVSRSNAFHPVWSAEQVVDFRIAHDILGHAASGGDFSWHGENLACAHHLPLLSPMAQKALFTEALGRSAYETHSPGYGTEHKIAFLDDVFSDDEATEQNGPGHTETHPSQSLAPVETPSVPSKASAADPLGTMLDEYERIGREVNPDGTWQCNTGANMLAHLGEKYGFPAEAMVGRYWHPNPESRRTELGEVNDDTHLDEEHYWTMLHHPERGTLLLDPNGQVRGEPRVQPAVNARGRLSEHYQGQNGTYEPFWLEEDNDQYWDSKYKSAYPLADLTPTTAAEWDEPLAEGIRRSSPGAGRHAATLDPNAGWESGYGPSAKTEDPESGAAYTDWGDPLGWDRPNADGLTAKDMAHRLDSGWSHLTNPDGSPNRPLMKKAIVNAFTATLLSPRKDLRWNAIHYQHLSDLAHLSNDPNEYHRELEKNRIAWNVARKLPLNAHKPYYRAERDYARYLQIKHPEWNAKDCNARAEHFVRILLEDEKRKVASELDTKEAKLPEEKRTTSSQVEIQAAQRVKKHLEEIMNPGHNPETDFNVQDAFHFGAALHPPGQTSLQGTDVDPSVTDLFNGDVNPEQMGAYGAWMGDHLKAVAAVSKRADEILDAALKDVHDHDAAGHHFRAAILNMGLPGVGPKVCSFAWLLLQPLTSQLATIDTHMMDVLGHEPEDMNHRDYFRMERELQARRDASGYGHVPLGPFQWAMWDHKRNGPDQHQDHSAMRVLSPLDHNLVDWNARANAPKGKNWKTSAPPWWKATDPAAEEVAQHFNDTIGLAHPQHAYPFREKPAYAVQASSTELEDNYVDDLAQAIMNECTEDQLPDESREDLLKLFRDYALLALTKGNDTSLEDVHDAWAAWMTSLHPDHESIVPFDDLSKEVKELDRPYMEYIHKHASGEGGANELHVSWGLPSSARNAISNWALSQDWPEGTEFEDPDDYHVTALYAESGWENEDFHDFVKAHKTSGVPFEAIDVREFGDGDEKAIVIHLRSPQATEQAERLIDKAEELGLEPNRHDGYKAHVTVAYGPGKPDDGIDIKFRGTELLVSRPRGLREQEGSDREFLAALGDPAPYFHHEDGTSDVGAPGMTNMQHLREYYPMSTEELWAMPGVEVGKVR